MRGINANVNTVNQAATEKSTTKRCKNKAHATDNNASTQLMQVSTMSTLSEAKESSKQAKLKYAAVAVATTTTMPAAVMRVPLWRADGGHNAHLGV